MIVNTLWGEEVINSKVCNTCGKEKPLSDFQVRAHDKHGNPQDRRNACKKCEKKKGKVLRELKQRISRPDSDYCCPICGRNEEQIVEIFSNGRTWVLDHDHDTNDFRGWLCDPCNVGLGRFSDDIKRLKNAIRYIESYKKKL